MTNCMNTLEGGQWEKREDIKRGYKRRQRMRRLSPNCWVHKRLPVCDPLSIQDQSVIGSNYCEFLCVLSTGREGGKEGGRQRKRAEAAAAAAGAAISPRLNLFAPAWIPRYTLNLWQTFLSTASSQLSGARLTASRPPLTARPSDRRPASPFPRSQTGSQVVAECFIKWWSGRSHRGHVQGAECVPGGLGAPFAGCRLGGGGGGMQLQPSAPTAAVLQRRDRWVKTLLEAGGTYSPSGKSLCNCSLSRSRIWIEPTCADLTFTFGGRRGSCHSTSLQHKFIFSIWV